MWWTLFPYTWGLQKLLFNHLRVLSIQNPEFGTLDAQAEAQLNIESLEEEVRQLEVHTSKATARLETLRGGGIDVAKWLQKAEEKSGSQDLLTVTSSLGMCVCLCVCVCVCVCVCACVCARACV